MMQTKPFEASVRSVTIRPVEGMVTIDLFGDINAEAERALNQAYGQAEVLDPERILLNFSAVGYINSTGIALIVSLLARARKAKRSLATCGLSDHYQEIFRITRLVDFMELFADEAEALAVNSDWVKG